MFLHQDAVSGIRWKDAWQVWCICMFLPQDAFRGRVQGYMFGSVYCVLLISRCCIFCVSCTKVPVAVPGAWSAFCVAHAVCSCIKMPLAVLGGRLHGRCAVAFVFASRCL